MNARSWNSVNRRRMWRCSALILGSLATTPAWSACPKLLMTPGLNLWKQTSPEQAAYWGRNIGVQGFLVYYIAEDWQTDVGTNQNSTRWQAARQFQDTYSRFGVTDNFIKISLHRTHNWRDPWQNEAVVKNFGHAAALAKFAGFKGIAMDLEPYVATWGAAAGGLELSSTVEQTGRQIGNAMYQAYPEMTLIILPDVLRANEGLEKKREAGLLNANQLSHGGYGLAIPFVRGLLSVHWKHVVIATEQTYSTRDVAPYVERAQQRYETFIGEDNALWTHLSIAPGLWPLGPSKWDKSPRETPAAFKQRLQEAFGASKQYVWIWSSNSAWQTDGPLGPVPGPVTANFQQYVNAIHQVRAACNAGDDLSSAPSPSPVPSTRPVPPRAMADPVQSIASSSPPAASQTMRPSAPAGTLPKIKILRPSFDRGVATEVP